MGANASSSLIAGYFNMPSEEDDQDGVREQERFDALISEPAARGTDIPLIETVVGKKDGETAAGAYSEATRQRIEQERETARRKIELVDISTEEQRFIRRLAGFLGSSPRRIKRYANTYRLLKSGLTQTDARIFGSGSDSNDDYRIVLVFLAIVTGAPTLAPAVFAKAFELRDRFEVDTLLSELGLEKPASDAHEAINVRGALRLLEGLDISREEIETWVPRVMRYAFRLTPVHLSGTPEQAQV